VNIHQPDGPGLRRRQVVAAGLAGAALSLGATRIVSAQTPPSPPRAPTGDDRQRLASALSIELAARDLYRDAVAAGASVLADPDGEAGPGNPELFQVLADNHSHYASVLAAELGASTTGVRDDALYDEWSSRFATSDVASLASDAYDFESILVATYIDLMGNLESVDAADIISSILVVEARHGAILADVAGLSDDLDVVLDDSAIPLALEPVGVSS